MTRKENKDVYINTQVADFQEEMLAFYEAYLSICDDPGLIENSRFALTSETARGFSVFMETVSNLPHAPWAVKGQVTGPITMGIGMKDQAGKLLFYDEQMRDIVTKQVAMKALWQVSQLSRLDCDHPPIIFLDEPGVVGFGSSTYISITREQIVESLGTCIDAIHKGGGVAGIHICANGDWSLALASGTDIINFDAFSYFDRLILYKDELKTFIKNGGILAWGIVPTSSPEYIDSASTDSLYTMWSEQLAQLESLGIARDKILSQTLITPSCGTGSLDLEHAVKVLKLTRDLSLKIRETLN
ncbi:uroporphyrinogen decarboxylase/cobalamine-independent methonine synthase family protein [Desulfocicer vacuolatum]|uniref:hypothetical protein n=1 Tax=Desulfocicer vacuolatum TaxID=2298 RepID=UPI001E5F5C18|nr:hypothetical protein [Desulfocicer vacuolatum]